MRWWEDAFISYCSSSSVFLQGKTKSKFLCSFLRKAPGLGEKRWRSLRLFTHQTLLNFFLFFLPSPYQAVSNSRIQTPSEINPEELVLLCPKEHPKRGVTCWEPQSDPTKHPGYGRNGKPGNFELGISEMGIGDTFLEFAPPTGIGSSPWERVKQHWMH